MISIALDVSTIDHQNLTGIGNYTKYLASSLSKSDQVTVTGSYKLSRLKNRAIIKKHLPGLTITPFIPFFSSALNSQFQIFHGPDFRIPNIKNCKKVVTIHDMVYAKSDFVSKEFKNWGTQRMRKVLFKMKPDRILTVSDFAREEFLSYYPQFESRTESIYLGCDHIEPINDSPKMFSFPYILFVGHLDRRKNIDGVIKAFELYQKQNNSELHLVIVGSKGMDSEWSKTIRDMIQKSSYEKQIVNLGYTTSEKLRALYRDAFCFLFPSFYEGFGIPNLEAMQLGCPVITSNLGAMKEVCGQAALFVDPGNLDEIANGIKSLQDTKLRSEIIQRGITHASSFTWKKCADKTISAYEKLI